MRILLDTHVWLWMWGDPQKLHNDARAVIEDPSTTLVISAASAWEIATKEAIGRLRLPVPAADWLRDERHLDDVEILPIAFDHAVRAGSLPPHHRDPFDRMLVAQAEVEGIVLATADRRLDTYGIQTLRA